MLGWPYTKGTWLYCDFLSLSLSLSLQRHHSLEWASASFKSFLHPSRFRATTVQFLHPSSAASSLLWLSFGHILHCVCFNLYCVCYNLFCNVWVHVCEGFVMCGCFGNRYTNIYCFLYCLYCVFVLLGVCIFILICFVCTSVRATATERQINWSK